MKGIIKEGEAFVKKEKSWFRRTLSSMQPDRQRAESELTQLAEPTINIKAT
jgi:hypothetical protein